MSKISHVQNLKSDGCLEGILRGFLVTLLDLYAVGLVIVLFILCMAALSLGLIIFIQDVNHSMVALKIELGDV